MHAPEAYPPLLPGHAAAAARPTRRSGVALAAKVSLAAGFLALALVIRAHSTTSPPDAADSWERRVIDRVASAASAAQPAPAPAGLFRLGAAGASTDDSLMGENSSWGGGGTWAPTGNYSNINYGPAPTAGPDNALSRCGNGGSVGYDGGCDPPSAAPSVSLPPTPRPSALPLPLPSPVPTSAPTPKPSPRPTAYPSPAPSPRPSFAPTLKPTAAPSAAPSPKPTDKPSSVPAPAPTVKPSLVPFPAPTAAPTGAPVPGPTPSPSGVPFPAPSPFPTYLPSIAPTPRPTYCWQPPDSECDDFGSFCDADDDGSEGLVSVNGGWYWGLSTAASGTPTGCLLVGIEDLSEPNSLWRSDLTSLTDFSVTLRGINTYIRRDFVLYGRLNEAPPATSWKIVDAYICQYQTPICEYADVCDNDDDANCDVDDLTSCTSTIELYDGTSTLTPVATTDVTFYRNVWFEMELEMVGRSISCTLTWDNGDSYEVSDRLNDYDSGSYGLSLYRSAEDGGCYDFYFESLTYEDLSDSATAIAADDDPTCSAITRRGLCQVASTCEWRSSDSTCLPAAADADDGAVTVVATAADDDDDEDDDDATCGAITRQGACQTASACEWRASDATCLRKATEADDGATATATDDATAATSALAADDDDAAAAANATAATSALAADDEAAANATAAEKQKKATKDAEKEKLTKGKREKREERKEEERGKRWKADSASANATESAKETKETSRRKEKEEEKSDKQTKKEKKEKAMKEEKDKEKAAVRAAANATDATATATVTDDDGGESTTAAADDDGGDVTCTAITRQGSCQTASTCEWRASDATCIPKSR